MFFYVQNIVYWHSNYYVITSNPVTLHCCLQNSLVIDTYQHCWLNTWWQHPSKKDAVAKTTATASPHAARHVYKQHVPLICSSATGDTCFAFREGKRVLLNRKGVETVDRQIIIIKCVCCWCGSCHLRWAVWEYGKWQTEKDQVSTTTT